MLPAGCISDIPKSEIDVRADFMKTGMSTGSSEHVNFWAQELYLHKYIDLLTNCFHNGAKCEKYNRQQIQSHWKWKDSEQSIWFFTPARQFNKIMADHSCMLDFVNIQKSCNPKLSD